MKEHTITGYPAVAHLPALYHAALPDLDTAGSDEILDMAALALRRADVLEAIGESPLHTRALCKELERLDLCDTEQRERIADLERDMALARQQVAAVRALLVVETAARVRHAETVDELTQELEALRADQRIAAGFDRLSLTVTGESYAVVADRLTASVYAERRGFVDAMFDRSEHETVVDVDTEVVL